MGSRNNRIQPAHEGGARDRTDGDPLEYRQEFGMQLQQTLSHAEVASAQRTTKTAVDLTPYLQVIDQLLDTGNPGAVIGLDEGDDEKAIRRGLTAAAKMRSQDLRYRRSTEGTLKFVLSEHNEEEAQQRKADAKARKEQKDAEAASKGNAPKERREKAQQANVA